MYFNMSEKDKGFQFLACYAEPFLPKLSWVQNNRNGMVNIWKKFNLRYVYSSHQLVIKTEIHFH